MSGLVRPVIESSFPAAVGTAFDILIKAELAKRLGVYNEEQYGVAKQLKEALTPPDAISLANHIFDEYQFNRRTDSLIKEGLESVSIPRNFEIDTEDFKVPIMTIPDACLRDGTIIDFKVSGAGSKTGASPTPGYSSVWSGGSLYKTQHERCGEPLELIKPDWAQQLTIYSWSVNGVLPWRDIKVGIENVTLRGDKVSCASIRTHVGIHFQKEVYNKLCNAWRNITEHKIEAANPSPVRCNNYNTLCEVAFACEMYQKIETDPVLRMLR